MVGVARPACVDPDDVAMFLLGRTDTMPSWEEKLRHDRSILGNNSPLSMIRTVTSFAGIYWFYEQLYRLGRGEVANLKAVPLMSMLNVMLTERSIEGKRKKLAKAAGVMAPVSSGAVSTAALMEARSRLKRAV